MPNLYLLTKLQRGQVQARGAECLLHFGPSSWTETPLIDHLEQLEVL